MKGSSVRDTPFGQGVSPRVVMEVLGHSEIAMTMNTYSHVIPQLRRDVADRMEALLTNER